ncbi:MAG: hypothetical protein U5L10_04285 [Candidatus Moranbacteria bacterium]|nr:hypothetical protein [Candidatus Moranbacteria bacterium]
MPIEERYIQMIKENVKPELPPEVDLFIFGSCLNSRTFNDVDIGVINGEIADSQIRKAKENLENTTFPYKFDLINFNKVDKKFKDKIFKGNILWIT